MKLLWWDCETTGLEPHDPKHAILEIAAAVAPFTAPFRLGPIASWVFPVTADAYWAADEKVKAMHGANGLWEACKTSTLRLHDVETALVALATMEPADQDHDYGPLAGEPHPDTGCRHCDRAYGATGEGFCSRARDANKTKLAGSSVGTFDLQWIRARMPRLAAVLSYRVYDVSAVELFCRSLGMPRPSRATTEAHRAAEDIEASVAHAVTCLTWLGQRSLFPTAKGGGR